LPGQYLCQFNRSLQIATREKYLVVIPGIIPHAGGYIYVSESDMSAYLDAVVAAGGRINGTAVVLPTTAYSNPTATGFGPANILQDLGRQIVLANPDGLHRSVYTHVKEIPGSTTYWVLTYHASSALSVPFARLG
jgi:hypothetical protein